MIILEGANLVGKTTLANALLARFPGWHYEHLGLLEVGWDYYWDYIIRIRRRVVQDRFHLSEWVYGNAIRGESLITADVLRLVSATVRLTGGIIVVITTSEENIRERYTDTEMFSVDQIQKVNSMFFDIGKHESVDYHVNIGETGHVTDFVDEIATRYQELQNLISFLQKGK